MNSEGYADRAYDFHCGLCPVWEAPDPEYGEYGTCHFFPPSEATNWPATLEWSWCWQGRMLVEGKVPAPSSDVTDVLERLSHVGAQWRSAGVPAPIPLPDTGHAFDVGMPMDYRLMEDGTMIPYVSGREADVSRSAVLHRIGVYLDHIANVIGEGLE